MCGLGAILARPGRTVRPETLDGLGRDLAHRGPDGCGFAVLSAESGAVERGIERAPRVPAIAGLVHRRLSIIDLTETGSQPMASADGRHWMVYNGEIYNYRELRSELGALGVTFTGASDSEVLLAAYRMWGPDCAGRFVGMFAAIILDVTERTVWVARDPFGIKPLMIARGADETVFASEMLALLRAMPAQRRLNPERVFAFLRSGQTDDGRATLLEGVEHLPAGHWATVSLDRPDVIEPVQFWSVPAATARNITFAQAVKETRERFMTSVELHLRSDVPVGACLSGGIDSSSIVCAMRALLGPKAELHAFSFIADNPADSEEQWIRLVADHTNVRLHTVTPDRSQLVGGLDRLIQTQGEPFGSTSIYAQRCVFELVQRAGVKVVLDGQGADELLAGYASFLGAHLAGLVRGGRFGRAWRMYRDMPRAHSAGPLSHLLAAQYLLPMSVQAPLRRLVGKEIAPAWLNADWFGERGVVMRPHFALEPGDLLKGELRHSIRGNLKALLRYEDRNAMAVSVESRVPFLTTGLCEFFLSLPDEFLIRPDGVSKYVFREAMRGIVPDRVLERRDKIGFRPPEAQWLRDLGPWADELLGGDTARSLPFFRHEALVAGWDRAMKNQRMYNSWFWRCLNLIRWVERTGAQV